MSDQNVVLQVERAFVSNTAAAPGNNATVVLFSTHPRKPGGSGTPVTSTFMRAGGTQAVTIAPDAIEEVDVTFTLHDKASAANGLRAYVTLDGGANWNETDMKGVVGGVANQPTIGSAAAIQVPALSTGQEWANDFKVGRYLGFALEYTAGTTGPTSGTGWAYSVAVKYAPQSES